MNKPQQLWIYLRSSFWFIPSLIIAGSIALALGLIEAEFVLGNETLARWPRLFSAGAESARKVLSTIAGSMMSVVGVTFSMTLVALALVLNTYTSRVLGNFMRSVVTQAVLGIFVGIFTYCLIVLRTIRDDAGVVFVPSVAVLVGVVLALAGAGALIFFIHHIAISIQASSLISSIALETIAEIDRFLPEKFKQERDEPDMAPPSRPPTARNWHMVPAPESGYIQSADDVALMDLARERNFIVRMERGVGEFVVKDTALVSLAMADPPANETVVALHSFYGISSHRTVEQDLSLGIRQIVDVALRALSPGVNDSTTAVTCVNYLTAILSCLATRHFPSPCHYDEEGELRLITAGPTFATLLAASFDEIRESAKGKVAVLSHMLDGLQAIITLTADARRREALKEQAQWIVELAHRSLESAHERALIDTRLARVHAALEEKRVVFAQDPQRHENR